MALRTIQINITSDVLCPFCWIGKRTLEKALAERADAANYEVVWHPFFLREYVPEGGIDKMAGYTEKFGEERARFLLLSEESPVKVYGREVGLQFNYTEGCRIGDTHKAHRLLWKVNDTHGHTVQNKLSEVLFRQFFQENRNPGEMDTLLDAVAEIGLDRDTTRTFLLSEELDADVRQSYRKAQARGINGVPYFDIVGPTGKKVSLSGARQPDEFVRVIDSLLAA